MALSKKAGDTAARVFLARGIDSGLDAPTLARVCDSLIRRETEISSTSAVALARKFLRSTQGRKGILLTTACRNLGWALLVSGNFRQAEKYYLRARTLLAREAAPRGRIDRILIDVYMYLGDFKEARRRARLSLAVFKRLGDEAESAKTRVNYANLLHRQDRHREAGQLYEQAARYFERHQNQLAAAFCNYNWANTLVQLFYFDRAGQLYKKARGTFLRHGHNLRATGCLNGLAWLHMLEGNYHIALTELANCERDYRQAAQPRELVLCRLDRAESFLGLNLYVDARETAREAEKAATKLGIRYESSKAAFFAAKASVALGKIKEARRSLERARVGFRGEGNRSFLAAANLLAAQLEVSSGKKPSAIQAARRKFTQAQLPLWEAICDLQLLSDQPDAAAVLQRLSKNPAVKTVPHLYARHHTMLGDKEAVQGHHARARRHWQQAADVLDAVRAKLPPVDLRTGFSRHQSDPYRKLIGAELNRDPVKAAAWSERFKTAGLWAGGYRFETSPVRSRAEKSLTELAEQVTAISGRLDRSSEERSVASPHARKTLVRLQQKVRQDLAAVEEDREARADRIETLCKQITAVSRDHPVVQFHSAGGDLIAFVHDRAVTHVHRYINGTDTVREFTGRWRFMVERAPYSRDRLSSEELADERRLLNRLGRWLWQPLEILPKEKKVLLLPEGEISNLPWQAIMPNGHSLVEDLEVVVAPSLRHYLNARNCRTRSQKISIFVGNTRGLPQASREYRALAEVTRQPVEVFDPCRREDWPNRSQGRIWHYTGHAQLRADNPFYSSLKLADGPLFAADFRLKTNRVTLVTLAACRTGQQASLPGEESTGLVRSLLEMGARNVIASHWAVSDKSTVKWMNEFYGQYLGGRSVGAAARRATLKVREKFPSAYNWAAFSVFGAGS